jgi:two-component system alkaline phosphatase synthesis response regulator PhoP
MKREDPAETSSRLDHATMTSGDEKAARGSASRSAAAVKTTILVVDDEADIRELLRFHLEQEGYAVLEAGDGNRALDLVRRERPSLLILDLMLPDVPGLEICRQLRQFEATATVPVLMLTARSEEIDRILGFEVGADDYVVKPFSPRELMARVKALLRRSNGGETERPHEVYQRGRLRMDFDTYEAAIDGKPLRLTLREFELLKFFALHPNRVFDRQMLLDLVWGPEVYVDPRTVDVHVRRLRSQIERDQAVPQVILTVRGVGYKFIDSSL